jgi:hypothetical protein
MVGALCDLAEAVFSMRYPWFLKKPPDLCRMREGCDFIGASLKASTQESRKCFRTRAFKKREINASVWFLLHLGSKSPSYILRFLENRKV